MPELVPIRHGRMLASPFAFFRGAAALMAADLAATPRTGLAVQLCGDAHLSNFGGFASPDRELVFDINDFDETAQGPWEWDVKRLAASIAVAGRELGLGADDAARGGRGRGALVPRRDARVRGDARPRVWYARLDVDAVRQHVGEQVSRKERAASSGGSRGRRPRTACGRFASSTQLVDGGPRIVGRPPLIVPVEELLPGATTASRSRRACASCCAAIAAACRPSAAGCSSGYRYAHMARRVGGVGSVGTRAGSCC